MRGDKHPVAMLAGISLVATAIGIAIGLAIDWFPTAASTKADEIDTLYDVLVIVSVPIFVLVMTVAIYSCIRWRALPGDKSDGAPIHGNAKLEVVWVVIPFIIVAVLAGYAWVVLDDVEAKQPNEMTVNVTGQQFAWRFEYPEQGVKSEQLYLPIGRPVHFKVKTDDVIHSFWVPEFRLKTDAVPGMTTQIRVTPDRLGEYRVVCAELCGLGHSTMRQTVRVVQPDAFEKWVATKKAPAEQG